MTAGKLFKALRTPLNPLIPIPECLKRINKFHAHIGNQLSIDFAEEYSEDVDAVIRLVSRHLADRDALTDVVYGANPLALTLLFFRYELIFGMLKQLDRTEDLPIRTDIDFLEAVLIHYWRDCIDKVRIYESLSRK